ncbi:MAG: glycosyltransferase [Rhodospirillaceae bacterium]|nr:glycosyltransferase [Rhodospirillales bacterium]
MSPADRALSIILVGQTIKGSRTPQRVRALERLGHRVRVVPINRPNATYEDPPSLADRIRYRLRLPADPAGANGGLLAEAKAGCDLVWVEAAPMIRAATLRAVKQANPAAPLVWYSEDDTMNPRHRSRWMERTFGLFDLWVTTKSFNAKPEEVPSLGARRVLFVHNSFDPTVHCPASLDEDERREWGADLGFVGTFEAPRAASILRLAQAGFTVRVWGNGWSALAGRHPNLMVENRPVYDDSYARVVSASRINLAFLRKGNRDLQTCRTMEIPACGGFMLHEYSAEAAALFPPDRAAAFFADDDELCRQAAHWLADSPARLAVAEAGRNHVLENAHSHDERLHAILRDALGDAG